MNGAADQLNPEVVFEGVHCTLSIKRPGLGVVLATFTGPDVGEFRDAPFRELAKDLAPGLPLELFIDAYNCPGPSINVSNEWARWMLNNKSQLHRVNILCGSRFVELTANFVRRFTDFGDRMRILTDRAEFQRILGNSVRS